MQERSPYAQVSLQAYPKIGVKFWLASSLALCYLGWGGEVRSQIAPDGSLSTNVTTPDNLNFTINDGNRAGNNLFHSFREFSVPTGGEAFFNNAIDIQNIFSRVTGLSISNIDGLIRANGTANLFLINPNGIIFGPNTRLNIGGSFLGSTANSIKFGDGVEFSATNPQAAPILSINVPIGLQYGNNLREIRVQGKGQEFGLSGTAESFDSSLNPLEVLPGKSLALVGGNVIIDGGILQAPGGRVELGGIAGEGTVGLNGDGSLTFPYRVARADVSIINKAGINVLAATGGSIEIKARNINILEGSLLSGGIGIDLESSRPAGNITLNATEAISINSSLIENIVNPNAYGNNGNIEISAKSVSVTGGARLDTSTFGKGDAGSVKITANDTVFFGEQSAAFSRVGVRAKGNGGDIEITAKSVSVTGGAQLGASTFGKGNAGSIKITADDKVSFDDQSTAFSRVGEGVEGNGSNIEITAKSVSVTGGAGLTATTFGQGNAGSIKITADDSVSFDDQSTAFIAVGRSAQGNGSGIEITAKSVSVTGGAQLAASAFGKGNVGSIRISADDSVSFDQQSGAFSTVEKGRQENGSDIEITAKSVSMSGGAQLDTNTFGKGDAGSVKITATDTVSFGEESTAFSRVEKGGQGNGGDIEITAKSVSVTSDAQLGASTFGEGDAGSVKITATDTVSFDEGSTALITVHKGGQGNGSGIEITAKSVSVTGGAGLGANTFGEGDVGSIKISANSVSVTGGAQLNTTTFGEGNGGSIKITADDSVSFDRQSAALSGVEEEAEGNGGDIEITAKSVSVTGGAVLAASTFGKGDAGSIKISADHSVSFDQQSATWTTVEKGGQGNGGGIEITAKSVSVTGGAGLSASTFGQGDAGSIKITADHSVSFDQQSTALSAVEEGAEGNGGDIEITAKLVFVTGGAQLRANTLGKGDAGSVKITATGSVSFDGKSAAFSNVEEGAEGKGGGIEITAKSVSVTGGAGLTASTFGKGDAGSVKITADNSVSFSGSIDEFRSAAFSSVGEGAEGKGGGIEITAKSVSVSGGAALTASTSGKGGAGNIKITASDIVSFDGGVDGFSSAAFSTVEKGAESNGGGIEITTGSLTITNGAALTATSAGKGLAGEIVVKADSILLENKVLVISNTTGGAGNIRLSAPAITLRGSAITTLATGGDSGGNIEVGSQFLQLRDGSRIATDASGADVKGGNITINTDILAALENSDISANSVNSFGGNVIINAQAIFGAQSRTRAELETLLNTKNANLLDPSKLLTSDITATGADSFSSGTVALNTPDVDPSSGLLPSLDNLVDVTQLVGSVCRRRREERGEFIYTGRGGIAPDPFDGLPDKATWLDLRPRLIQAERESGRVGEWGNYRSPISNSQLPIANTKIVEAQGWIVNAQGEVELVAQAPTATPHNSGFAQQQCYAP